MTRRDIRSWLMDMDGVLVQEQQAVPGAQEFPGRLRELGLPFLVLTNKSIYTQRDLAARLMRAVPEGSIRTSALATARRPESRGPAARDRLGRSADQPRDRRRPVLRRQAEPADDALGFAVTRPRNLRILTTTFRPMSEDSSG